MTFLWKQVLGALEQRLPGEQIDEWLRPVEVLDETEKSLNLTVPNDIFIDWIQENYLEEIYLTLRKLNKGDLKVFFLSSKEAEKIKKASEKKASPVKEENVQEIREVQHRFNPKYRFDCFVVGPSNQFAHAAALAVAEAPSASYNPLYLYGASGLGKTHLLHAIGHSLIEHRSDLKICYTTCEEFTNQFINSIRFNKGEAFRERYRSVDILLIDDIQFLSGKTQTQEEFFHTFNALFEQQKQIILSF